MTAVDLLVVPCSAGKVDRAVAEAGKLYTGALHRAARLAADALPGQVVILSANYGLLDLAQRVETYDRTFGQPGAVTAAWVADQVHALAPARVVSLCPRRYTDVLRAACELARVELVAPLAGSSGVGVMRGRLAAMRRAGRVL